jgi:hypothetical protein
MAKEGARRQCGTCGTQQEKRRGKWTTVSFATRSLGPHTHKWSFVTKKEDPQ